MRSTLILACALCLIFASCEKNEIPVAPFDRGEIFGDQVDLGTGYSKQVHYSLDAEAVAGSNLITDWDLAFEGGDNGWKVILNDSRMMTAWKTDFTEIASANDSSGFGNGKKVEVIATAYSNPAMGDWRENSAVYLVDLGYDLNGLQHGLYWVELISVSPENYTFKYRAFNASDTKEATIPKQSGDSYERFSIRNNQMISGLKDADWDIAFTKYTYQFIEPPQPYLVTGLILNPKNTAAAEIFDRPFEEISMSDTINIVMSTQPDIIGYDWKYYAFDASIYEIDATRTWIIRTASGFYYKFRFTDFYDDQGHAGVPSFEFGKI